MPSNEEEEFEFRARAEREHGASSAAPAESKPSTFDVFKNAAYEGAAGVPDSLLNTPNRVMNLGKAAFGSAANALGRPDLAPDLTPDPNYARQGLTKLGLIKEGVKPQGGVQKAVDVLTQGAVGGALTGGASLPGATSGAAMGALSSGAGAAAEAATGNPAWGAVAGMAVPAAADKVFGGMSKVPENVQKLKEAGVQMTPGQIIGGKTKAVEDAMTSFPVLGPTIQSARARGIESFDEAAFNRALEPVGEKLPKGLTGTKAVSHVESVLGERYDDLLSKSKGSLYATGSKAPALPGQPTPPGMSLDGELQNIRTMAVAGKMPPEQLSELDSVMQKEVRDRFNANGLASGDSMKKIESFLGQLAKKKELSSNYHDNELGGAIKEMQAALRRMIERENPQYAGELQKINEGWANFKRVQAAASSVGAPEGVFTPAQLHRAVKTVGKTKDDSAFARGGALMQDLSAAGKSVLPSSVPDSGTAFRTAMRDVWAHPLQGVAGGVASLAYSPPVQRALQTYLTSSNPSVKEAARRSLISLGITQNDIDKAGIGRQ